MKRRRFLRALLALPVVAVLAPLLPVGARWVDVKTYGAIGDGAHDDYDAFRAASRAVGFGGTVFVPPGHYRVRAFPWDGSEGVTIQGIRSEKGTVFDWAEKS